MAFAFAYAMKSSLNGAVYVGVTCSPIDRFKTHIQYIRANNHHCLAARDQFAGHKESDLKFEILEVFDARSANCPEANQVEAGWIARMGAINTPRAATPPLDELKLPVDCYAGKRPSWDDADWSKSDEALSREYHDSVALVRWMREYMDAPAPSSPQPRLNQRP